MIYQVRFYIMTNPRLIFNYAGPESHNSGRRDPDDTEQRMLDTQAFVDERNKRDGFYNKLEANIIAYGIRNPITVRSGWTFPRTLARMPTELRDNILICDEMGGSRLYAAQRLDIPIPIVVSDFDGEFADEELLETHEDIENKFKDKPKKIRFTEHGVDIL